MENKDGYGFVPDGNAMHELYSVRMLVFLETEPQSNKYHQVFFTAEEFKKFSESIGTVKQQRGEILDVEVRYSEEIYDLPDLKELN